MGQTDRQGVEIMDKLETKSEAGPQKPLSRGKRGAASWGEVVVVVAPDDVTAQGYIDYRGSLPEDQYIYRHAKTATDIRSAFPPQVVRVECFGRWWENRPRDFVHEVERLIADVERYATRLDSAERGKWRRYG